uniref:Uncharacterized protein n=2 Tax=viral metagenome TaxID=1070528 RepID=A0A6M3XKW0_9ZZZZ
MGNIDSLYVVDKTKGACYNETTKKAFCQVECAYLVMGTQTTICGHDFGLVEFFKVVKCPVCGGFSIT